MMVFTWALCHHIFCNLLYTHSQTHAACSEQGAVKAVDAIIWEPRADHKSLSLSLSPSYSLSLPPLPIFQPVSILLLTHPTAPTSGLQCLYRVLQQTKTMPF